MSLSRRSGLGHTLLVLLASAPAALPDALPAEEPVTAFTGARVLPVAGDPIESGTLVIRGGKIEAVGPANSTAIPAGATRIEAAGKVILPGLICTHSHIGGMGGADGSAPIQPDVRILDSLNVRDSGFRRAVAGGLTTLNWVFPTFSGPGNKSIKLTHSIPDNVPAGATLQFNANVSAPDGRSDTDSATVEVRN